MSAPDYLQALVVLSAMIAVLALGGLILRKVKLPARFAPDQGRRISVAETRWLDNRTRLVLIRWDEREHLLLVTPQHTSVIPGPAMSAVLSEPPMAGSNQ
jgi:flagellar protein FliO/FliZ